MVAMLAVFFTAVVVVLTGLAAFVVQLFRKRPGPDPVGRAPGSRGRTTMRTDDAIDVVTTKVPDDPPGR